MSENREIAIQIDGVKKRYKLGTIGGGTLVGDIQSWWARVRHKEDPTKKIGAKTYGKNETFMALDGIDLTIYKGERVGIIGHNGAGKSTLLKLLSRVTGPTEGEIGINGRISSMLEVGTGFNGELTGRENVYINGAILGMTKAEVDAKMDQIIEFSECAQFIDTPVKRYSSGMYVKLAFSVAAHLDSEIMIMDEVLAVGDINFQHKCLNKMKEVGNEEGRTILYVSHNMATIRQLCTRCVVLSHGKVIFDGDVEKAIEIYSTFNDSEFQTVNDLASKKRLANLSKDVFMEEASIMQCAKNHLKFALKFNVSKKFNHLVLRLVIFDSTDNVIGTSHSNKIEKVNEGNNEVIFDLDTTILMDGKYRADLIISDIDDGAIRRHDVVQKAFRFEIIDNEITPYGIKWNVNGWGKIQLKNMEVMEKI